MKILDFLKIAFIFSVCCFSTASMADTANNQQPSEVACHYVSKVIPNGKSKALSSSDWFFWRNPNMIQTLDADGDHGEIWQRTANNSIQYRKLYHADKTAVEYMPADMPTNNMNFDWIKLSSMLNQQELDALKPVKQLKVLGRNAELRKGKINDKSIEVIWLLDENLPASIIRKDKAGSVELNLVEITPLSAAKKKPITIDDINNYRQIDAVDFGDMENDPFVKKVMQQEGHHHH
jgi:hypothetical protein